MKRQTPLHHRWTLMSVAVMVTLLGSSVGCLSVNHHLRRHTVFATAAEKHQGRYFHCPHCGQIILRGGSNKCPQCFPVPAYHGYEATCWRQWPQGWGCPPEALAAVPELLEPGLVESHSDLQVLPEMDVPQAIESSEPGAPADDSQPLPRPPAEPNQSVEPNPSEVSVPQAASDIVSTEPKQEIATETIPAAATTATTVTPIDVVIDALSPSFDVPELQDEPAKSEPTATPAMAIKLIREPAITQAPVASSAASILVAEEPAPKAAGAVTGVSVFTPTYDIQYGPIDEEKPAKQAPLAISEPPFDHIGRIVKSTSKGTSTTESSSNNGPVLLRTLASVIKVGAAAEPQNVTTATQHASHINPFDERGPIPVRSVRLTNDASESQPAQPDEPAKAEAKEVFPAPVNRVELPGLVPGRSDPLPIRRIQLSELPVKIQQ